MKLLSPNIYMRAWPSMPRLYIGLAFASSPESPRAQTAQAAPGPQQLQPFLVTGSHLALAADRMAVPVTAITAEEITRTGVTTNAFEVIRNVFPQFQGNTNIGADNANINAGDTGGGSQASLRNLTTLTLINGRRVAVSPITGTGGNQFVDLNIIPLAAIDRIEVLLDGASATYGSDATSGVVNFKTRRDYQGGAVRGFYEWTDNHGHWANRGANFIAGSGNGRTHFTVAGGYSRQDPLFQFERSFSNPTYGSSSYGGVINVGTHYFVLNPALSEPPVGPTKPVVAFPLATAAVPLAPGGRPYFGVTGSEAVYWGKVSAGNLVGFGAGELGAATTAEAAKVAFNLSDYVTLLQRREAKGALVSFDHKFTEGLSFFGDLLIAKIDTFAQVNAQPIGALADFNVTENHPYNPFAATVRVRNRFLTNPRSYLYDTSFVRGVAGLRGRLGEQTTFESAMNLNHSQLAYQNPGVIDAIGLLAAAGIRPAATAAGQALNLFQRDVPESEVRAGGFVGAAYKEFESKLNSWDGRIITRAANLPSGPLTLALGVELRRESLAGDADSKSIPNELGLIGWTGASSVNPFSARRRIESVFAEVLVPLTGSKYRRPGFYRTELSLAVRHERYSDTQDPTVPKLSLRWQPFGDDFALRSTYSESFNAPSLYRMFGPVDVGFSEEARLLPFAAADQPGNYVNGQSQSRIGSNPQLTPTTSRAYTVGLVYSPRGLKGLSFDVSYWNIEERDVVDYVSSRSVLQSVETLGPNSPYVRHLANGQPNPAYVGDLQSPRSYDVRLEGFSTGRLITAPGQVANNLDSVYLTRPYVNISRQSASGIDFTLKYQWTSARWGRFDARSNFVYWEDYELAGEELAGRATIKAGTIPRWANYASVSWEQGALSGFVSSRYLPEIAAPDQVGAKKFAEAYATFDLGLSYSFGQRPQAFFKGFRVQAMVKNVGNEKPVVLAKTFTNANADIGTYDPVGRRFLIVAGFDF